MVKIAFKLKCSLQKLINCRIFKNSYFRHTFSNYKGVTMGFLYNKFAEYTRRRKEQKFIQVLSHIEQPNLNLTLKKDFVAFSHVGLLGDIIYSIPCMMALAGERKIKLYLDTSKDSGYSEKLRHYNKGKMLTPQSIELLKPLMLAHPKILECEKLETQSVDYNLNDFRKYPFDYRMGHICRWYFLTFGVSYDLSQPWLYATPNDEFSNFVIVSRSFRYRTPLIDYRFLSFYKNVGFIGLADEYADMKKSIPHLHHIKVNNALEMASIIAGCKLFIGNQSFPFSVAEALKVKRVLEVNFENPNVIVDGNDGYDFCYQPQFEKIVHSLLD